MLKKMEDAEEEKGRLKKLEEDVKVGEDELKQRSAELETETKNIDGRIGGFNGEREELLPYIESSILRIYTRILRRTGGAALVPIRNKTCDGCHLYVTPQVVNLAARQEELVICENCSRILYYRDEEEREAVETGEGEKET